MRRWDFQLEDATHVVKIIDLSASGDFEVMLDDQTLDPTLCFEQSGYTWQPATIGSHTVMVALPKSVTGQGACFVDNVRLPDVSTPTTRAEVKAEIKVKVVEEIQEATGIRPGTQIAGYAIRSRIGGGGTSVVYKAEQLALGREVAFKVLAAELASDASYRERFIRESKLAAAIDHPSILPVYDAGETGGYLYIVSRLVTGSTLGTLLEQKGALEATQALAYLSQIASALDAAHAKGLIHRDIKPSNLLVEADHLYLTDFGVAKSSQDAVGLTRVGMFLGTIDYASPEQILGEAVDGRTDLYALACVFYHCLTGQVPFDRPSEHAILQAHLLEAPPPLSQLRADLPPGLDVVFARAMAKDKDQRYQTGRVFIEAVQTVLRATGSSASSRMTVIRKAHTAPSPAPAMAPAIAPARAPMAPRAATYTSSTGATTQPFLSKVTSSLATLSARVPLTPKQMLFGGAGLLLVVGLLFGANLAIAALKGSGDTAAVPSPAPSTATAVAVAASPAPTPRSTTTPVPTAASKARLVFFRPEQIIMPLAEFPLPGWTITTDKTYEVPGGKGWRRDFTAPAGSPYFSATMFVFVLAPEIDARAWFKSQNWCEGLATHKEVPALPLGDQSSMCKVTATSAPNVVGFQYNAVSRNVAVNTILVSSILTSETSISAQAIAITKKQFEIIDRVSPR